MNRLTKKISLVLISSSLAMHGCYQEPKTPEEEKRDEQGQNASGSGASGHRSHTSFWPIFLGGGRGSGGTSVSPSTRSGFRSGGASHGSVGGSSRGGFGSSAHGVGS